MRHKFKAQLRFNDIDVLGHVNNTVYLSLYDLGKAEYLEEVGIRKHGPEPPKCVIVDIHCSYHSPIFYGDDIFIYTRCKEIGHKSFTLEQEMIDGNGKEHSICTTVMVYIDPDTNMPAPLPENYRRQMQEYEERHENNME